MPVVLRSAGYTFFFFSNEGDPRKPPHVHVRRAGALAKFWLQPTRLAESRGFDARTLNAVERLVDEHSERIVEEWDERFGDRSPI